MSDTGLNLKQVLLTAFVTCVFTIVAGVVTYLITSKQPVLSYSVTSGPTLSIQGVHKRIFAIEVINSGRKEIVDASATIEITSGKIDEVAYEASAGLIVTENRQEDSYHLKAATLNPKESFSISVSATIPEAKFTPVVAVRGKGITGSPKKAGKKEGMEVIFFMVGSMASVLGLAIAASLTLGKVRGFRSFAILARSYQRSGSSVGPFMRNELVAYILSLCSLKELSQKIRFAPSETSFRGASDYVVSEAITSEKGAEQNYVKALKCMLLIKRMNQDSVDVIAAALAQLAEPDENEIKELREAAVDEFMEPVVLREKIAKLLDNLIDDQQRAAIDAAAQRE